MKNKKHKQQAKKKKTTNIKKILAKIAIGLAFFGILAVAFTAYSHSNQKKYDTSVIGNGVATVVQIHDANCQLCRQLKSNLDSVKGDFKGKVQFKIANIKSYKGKRFAAQHKVGHVTLLFFNKRGRLVNTLRGVSQKKVIRTALESLVK